MSDDERRRRTPKDAERTNAKPTSVAAIATTTCAVLRRPAATPGVLTRIAHPPNLAALVVAHEQRAFRQNEQADGSAPACTIRKLPATDEILDSGRPPAAAIEAHADDLGTCGHGAIPRALQCYECVAAIVARKLVACVEREAQRCGVRLHGDGRRLDFRAVSGAVLGIGLPGQIALRPSVVASFLDDVDMFGRQVVAEIVAIVIPAPQLSRCWIERHADRIAESFGEHASTRSIGIEPRDRGPQRIAFIADIAGRPDSEIQLPVGSEDDGPGGMAATGNVGHDGRRLTVAGIESLYVTHFGDVHRVATKGESEWPTQSAHHGDGAVGDAIAIRIDQLDDYPSARLGRVDDVPRPEREITHAFQVLCEDGTLEA